MKICFCAALLLAALALTILSGCSGNAPQRLDRAEEILDRRLDAAEEKLESRIESVFTEAAVPKASAPAAEPTQPVIFAAPETVPVQASAQPAETRLTKEEARDIALKHAGLSAEAVRGLRVEFDYDDGRPEYDVEFHQGGYEYDYEIHAETGNILSWDKDRDD